MCKNCPPLASFLPNKKKLSPEEQSLISDEEELRYGIKRDRQVLTNLKQDILKEKKEQAISKKDMKGIEEELNWLDKIIEEHGDSKKAIPPLKKCSSGVCDYAEFTDKTICPDCGVELKIY